MAKEISSTEAGEIAKSEMERISGKICNVLNVGKPGRVYWTVEVETSLPPYEGWVVKVKRTNGEIGPFKQV